MGGNQIRHQQRRDRRRSGGQWRRESRRSALQRQAGKLSGHVDQPVQSSESRLGRNRGRCWRTPTRNSRAGSRTRPLAAGFLELRRAGRCAGLGPRSHDNRVWMAAGRHRRAALVHRSVQRHVECIAGGRRRHRVRARQPVGEGCRPPYARPDTQQASHDRQSSDRCARHARRHSGSETARI